MIYVWKARPASSRRARRRRQRPRTPLLAAALFCLAASAAAIAPADWPPQVALDADAASDPTLRAMAAADRAWLNTQPPALLKAPEPGAGEQDLLAWLQRTAPGRSPPGERAIADTTQATAPVAGQRDLLSLMRDRWVARGYLAARLTLTPAAAGSSVPVITVEPGRLHTWGELAVEGDDFTGRDALLAGWLPRTGDMFLPERYREAALGVVAACAESGFPFPIWLTRSLTVDPAAARVDVAAVLIPGPRMIIGPQRSNLAHARGEAFLLRATGVRSGIRFRESDLRRGRDRLLARDLYLRVDEPFVHVTTASDTVGIVWRVEPQERPNRLAAILGLSRRDEGGSRLSGQIDLDLPNLAGTGRRLTTGWKDDGRSRSRFGFCYFEPLVAGTPLDADLELESEVQEDIYTRFTVDNRWRLPVISLWGLEVGLGWDRTTYPVGETEAGRRWRGRAGILRSRGDRERSGWSGMFAVETVSRSTTLRRPASDGDDGAPPASQLGSHDRQRLIEVDAAGEIWLGEEFSLAGRASLRRNIADSKPVPLSEQYRFGGATSLRGYREDEFNGETAAWGGLEMRLGRARRSRVYTFVDVGYFEVTVRSLAGAGVELASRSGTNIGFGLGLYTAAAPGQLNLAVGFPGDVQFETAKLHVALVGSF